MGAILGSTELWCAVRCRRCAVPGTAVCAFHATTLSHRHTATPPHRHTATPPHRHATTTEHAHLHARVYVQCGCVTVRRCVDIPTHRHPRFVWSETLISVCLLVFFPVRPQVTAIYGSGTPQNTKVAAVDLVSHQVHLPNMPMASLSIARKPR